MKSLPESHYSLIGAITLLSPVPIDIPWDDLGLDGLLVDSLSRGFAEISADKSFVSAGSILDEGIIGVLSSRAESRKLAAAVSRLCLEESSPSCWHPALLMPLIDRADVAKLASRLIQVVGNDKWTLSPGLLSRIVPLLPFDVRDETLVVSASAELLNGNSSDEAARLVLEHIRCCLDVGAIDRAQRLAARALNLASWCNPMLSKALIESVKGLPNGPIDDSGYIEEAIDGMWADILENGLGSIDEIISRCEELYKSRTAAGQRTHVGLFLVHVSGARGDIAGVRRYLEHLAPEQIVNPQLRRVGLHLKALASLCADDRDCALAAVNSLEELVPEATVLSELLSLKAQMHIALSDLPTVLDFFESNTLIQGTADNAGSYLDVCTSLVGQAVIRRDSPSLTYAMNWLSLFPKHEWQVRIGLGLAELLENLAIRGSYHPSQVAALRADIQRHYDKESLIDLKLTLLLHGPRVSERIQVLAILNTLALYLRSQRLRFVRDLMETAPSVIEQVWAADPGNPTLMELAKKCPQRLLPQLAARLPAHPAERPHLIRLIGMSGEPRLAHYVRHYFRDKDSVVAAATRQCLADLNDGQDDPLYPLLQPRELEILELASEGLSNGEIADEIFISNSTVKTYMNRIFRKLHVSTRTGAVKAFVDSRAGTHKQDLTAFRAGNSQTHSTEETA